MSKVLNATAMGFVRIAEMYPNDYILVRIIEINHDKGTEIGLALYTASTWQELENIIKNEGLLEETTIVQGVNLLPLIGGLL
jgi:hypothetical protein